MNPVIREDAPALDPDDDNRLVPVCAHCLRACCWLLEFTCDDVLHAEVVEMRVGDLRNLGFEHPSYWAKRHVRAA